MQYISTKKKQAPCSISKAMMQGLANDGGLFIPEYFPKFHMNDFDKDLNYSQFCAKLLAPFFKGDTLEAALPDLCFRAFNFPLIVKPLDDNTKIVELFHGPTLSFKDFGARFLAECFSQLSKNEVTIMVATSGDTGSAVASAFHQKPNTKVIVLFPLNKISERQQQQITCWGDNIHAFAVDGTFDDCQRMVKQAKNISTANSINIGRLLPQMAYYAFISLNEFRDTGVKTNFVVPCGNLGNVTAACYARACGFPIDQIVIATNANQIVPDYLETGLFQPKPSIQTLANAMDVGCPSNFERLTALYPTIHDFRDNLSAYSVSDAQISESIASIYNETNEIVCPHTATACSVRMHELMQTQKKWLIAATADPCKFESVIEPLINVKVPVAIALEKMLGMSGSFDVIQPDVPIPLNG